MEQTSEQHPRVCPFCLSENISSCIEWEAHSLDPFDLDNEAELTEYQCRNEEDKCCRSFWA